MSPDPQVRAQGFSLSLLSRGGSGAWVFGTSLGCKTLRAPSGPHGGKSLCVAAGILTAAFVIALCLVCSDGLLERGLGTVQGSQQGGRRMPDASAAVLDFTSGSLGGTFAYMDVLNGTLQISANNMPLGLVAEVGLVIRDTLATTAGVSTSAAMLNPTSTIPSFNQTLMFTFTYWLIPPAGSSRDCSNVLVASAAGDPQPFLVSLTRALSKKQPTSQVSTYGWAIIIPPPVVTRLAVNIPPELKSAAPITTRPTTTAAETTVFSTVPRDVPAACSSFTSACMCAADSRCAWVTQPSGLYLCQIGSGGVTCTDCSLQPQCPAAQCASQSTPCGCAALAGLCGWDDSTASCAPKSGGSTSCAACGSQSFCIPPKVSQFTPSSGSMILPRRDLTITLTFSATLKAGALLTASFACTGSIVAVSIPADQISVKSNALVVSTQRLAQLSNRNCSLIIPAGTVTDTSYVPFLGLQAGDYSFQLGDSALPDVMSFSPPNGARGVDVSLAISFAFTKPVVWTPLAESQSATISVIQDSSTDVSSAQAVAVALKSKSVVLDTDTVKVDLTGIIKPGAVYTVGLPSGCVMDLTGNLFAGLPSGSYMFQTNPAARSVSGGGNGGSGSLVVSLGAAGGGLVSLAILGIALWRLRTLMRDHHRSSNKASAIQPELEEDLGSASRFSSRASIGALGEGFSHPHIKTFCSAEDLESSWGTRDFNASQLGSTIRSNGSVGSGAKPFKEDDPAWSQKSSTKGNLGEEPANDARWAQKQQARRAWREAFARAAMAHKGPGAAGAFAAAAAAAASHRRSTTAEPAGPGATRIGASHGRSSTFHEAPRPEHHAGGEKSRSSRASSQAGASKNSSSAGAKSSTSSGTAANSAPEADFSSDPPELKQQKLHVERKLRDQMSAPLEERKKLFKQLMLEYHPDKNQDKYAKDVFQFINASRGWFLQGA